MAQYSTRYGPSLEPNVGRATIDSPVAVQLVGVSNGCADDAAAATKPDWSHNDANRAAGTAPIS